MRRWTIPVLILLVVAVLFWQQRATAPVQSAPMPTSVASTAPPSADASIATPVSEPSASAASGSAPLPSEVADTLSQIRQGGPFAHRQDGVVFQNREHRLPGATYGYYHEYTVPTPGVGDRGARRIITGGDPPSVYYYTDDHYQNFRTLEVVR